MYIDIPTRAEISALLEVERPSCVTLYLPTSPLSQEARGDRIAFKNQSAEALRLLREGGAPRADVEAIGERLAELEQDYEFWALQANSLAVFATPAGVQVHRLPSRLSADVRVGDRFALRPLLRATAFPHAAFVLGLAQSSCRVLELTAGDRPSELRVPDLPSDQESAVGRSHVDDPSQMTHLLGAEGDKMRMRQYARLVNGALRSVLAGRELPLILAAAPPLDAIFRAVNSYPHLADGGIAGNPEALSDLELAAAARPILDGLYAAELEALRSRLVLLREFRVGRVGVRWAAAVVGRWGSAPFQQAMRRCSSRTQREEGQAAALRWRAPAFEGQEGVGDRDERDVVVPAAVAAALEVVEAEGVFELAVVVLDAPAQLGQPDQLGERGVGGQGGEPVVGRRLGAGGPFGQQPADRQLGRGRGRRAAQLAMLAGRTRSATKRECIGPREPSRHVTSTRLVGAGGQHELAQRARAWRGSAPSGGRPAARPWSGRSGSTSSG